MGHHNKQLPICVLSAASITYLVAVNKLNTIYGEIRGEKTRKACRFRGRPTVR
jgi:hypothetical protein